MQSLHDIALKRGAEIKLLICRCGPHYQVRPARITIFIQDKVQGLATKAYVREHDAERPSNDDSSKDHSKNKEPLKSSAMDGAKEHDEYYSLKMHREGPNTESGELHPKTKSKDVARHNEDMVNRYDKR
ncbi:hypothetical protein N7540_013139 [Penicillium herquei]|nr:hypothetical protein N7540_013139 [Penicillium herquei]